MSREVRALGRELRPEPAPARRPLAASVAGWLVRHLPELVLVLVLVRAWQWTASRTSLLWTELASAALVAVMVCWERSRRWLLAVGGCLLTRARLRAALAELRLSGRGGRPPLVVGLLPTATGERVWLLCPVRVAAEDLADEADRLAAACFARTVRASEHRRWSALVVLDIVRRRGPVRRPAAEPGLVPRFPVRVARHRA
jgi:hypothetical protein